MSELLGRYIVIEGTDGAGTTTQKELLEKTFSERNEACIAVAEPGGTPIGDALRLIIKDGSLERSAESNLDLFVVCRRELARQVMLPALEAGKQVISDRNWFSTVAYQGFGEGLDVEMIVDRMSEATGKLVMPHVAIIIDVPLQVSMERTLARGTSAADTFEKRGETFFEKVREGYLWVAEKYNLPVVDGTQSVEKVHADIMQIVDGEK